MSDKFVIPDNKESEFRKFILLSVEHSNLSALIKVHTIELHEGVGDEDRHKKMIAVHLEELKKIVEERAHVLSDLLDGKYLVEELNSDDLTYWYNYLTREVIFYE